MSLQYLKLDAITEAQLARLAVEGIGETKTLEYKQALTFVTDEQKRELLSDLAALANTDGGDLVFGMAAEKGVATELIGLKNFVADEAIGRIENLLRDFVQPRIAGVVFRVLPLVNGNQVLLIRVPRSFSSPHMIRHHGVTRFCGRNANGKYDLDVHELRSAFLASETFSDRLKAFRLERINRLLSGNGPVPLAGEHVLVMHILPVIGAGTNAVVSTSDLQRVHGEAGLRPPASRGWNHSFNFDGLLVADAVEKNQCQSYIQILRSGFIEAVNTGLLEPRSFDGEGGPKVSAIPSIAWERVLIEAFTGYLQVLAKLALSPPYVVSLSLLNVRGYIMWVGGHYYGTNGSRVDRDHLLCDEVLFESTPPDSGRALRPLFDQVWNACGWHGSINYDEAGDWRRHA